MKKKRKAGSQWLVTRDECEVFIPEVNEEITDSNVSINIIAPNQYCQILDYVDEEGKPQLGKKKYVKGPNSFFLQPGESIYGGIKEAVVLTATTAIWVTAKETFSDDNRKRRRPGDKWAIYGPGEYWPPSEVEILRYSYAILPIPSLGIYFFNFSSLLMTILVLVISIYYGVFRR